VSNLPAQKKTVHELPGAADAANSPSAKNTVFETSAGGVVLRHIRGEWQVALIEPNIINADTITRRAKARPEGTVFALPKGGVDEGETPEQSADREVFEETGVRGLLLFRLTTIRYLYVRSWGGREHVSKAVSFYLFLYASGRLGQIRPDMRDEVRRAFWFPLDKAHRKLTYRGEREVLKMTQKIVREHPERLTPPALPHSPTGPGASRPTAQQRGPSQRGSWQARNPAQGRSNSAPGRGSPAQTRNSGQGRNSAQTRNSAQGRNSAQTRNSGQGGGNPGPGRNPAKPHGASPSRNSPPRGAEPRKEFERPAASDAGMAANPPARSYHK
jgi:ADP-ribose pyrophosphatase YjhB (NUDIX family)